MKMLMIVFVLSLASCAHIEPNKNFWMGRSSDELLVHPVFAVYPLEKRVAGTQEVWTFKNGDFVNSPNYACNHVFQIRDKKISNYSRLGNCTEKEAIEFRPVDKDNQPLYSESETKEMNQCSPIDYATGKKGCEG